MGRFGLGLKTASFSQTRKFSVISKCTEYNPVFWAWDLDHVNQVKLWELIQFTPLESEVDKLKEQDSGTSVIWYCLDRILKNTKGEDTEALGKFMELMEGVKKHLEMVFHRFLEQGKIKIWFQDRKIEAWDPFLRGENGIQSNAEEFIARANSFCGQLDDLEKIRMSLRQMMLDSSLCDPKGYVTGIEDAYRKMWHKWCKSQGVEVSAEKFDTAEELA